MGKTKRSRGNVLVALGTNYELRITNLVVEVCKHTRSHELHLELKDLVFYWEFDDCIYLLSSTLWRDSFGND